MSRSGLTKKQEIFCIEYSKTGNIIEAVRVAGFSAPTNKRASITGTRLLSNPNVKKKLAEISARVEDEAIADIVEIKRRLTAILRQETEEEVLMTECVEKGVTQTVRYKKKADVRSAAKAAELLAKMAGAFQDQQVNVGVQVQVIDDLKE